MKQVLVIVHQETSDPGRIGELLRSRGYQLDMHYPCLGQALPETLEQHEATVVFGGPMSANDDGELPFIRAELDWIPLALESGKPFLGICLGAQLLARVLGASVHPHSEDVTEVGYVPISPTAAGASLFGDLTHVYQWHQEGFDLPTDATLLATSADYPHQAFHYDRAIYGLQFHPEVTCSMVDLWTTRAAEKLAWKGAQSKAEHLQKCPLFDPAIAQWTSSFIDIWLSASPAISPSPLPDYRSVCGAA
ncbi:MAG: gamma-glutamyl-gamma-aminobutyrate hydrolase family protein [Cyanobacteria bacterium P01_E01_bin.48]